MITPPEYSKAQRDAVANPGTCQGECTSPVLAAGSATDHPPAVVARSCRFLGVRNGTLPWHGRFAHTPNENASATGNTRFCFAAGRVLPRLSVSAEVRDSPAPCSLVCRMKPLDSSENDSLGLRFSPHSVLGVGPMILALLKTHHNAFLRKRETMRLHRRYLTAASDRTSAYCGLCVAPANYVRSSQAQTDRPANISTTNSPARTFSPMSGAGILD